MVATTETCEFSRLIRLDQITDATTVITATAEECRSLAKRFELVALHHLTATVRLRRHGPESVRASGRVAARWTQNCIVTLEPVDSAFDETFAVTYAAGAGAQAVLDPSAEDVLELPPDVIDIGELAAQQLGLAIDPYPRAPGAALPELDTGSPERPFSALRPAKART
ncbi:MAG: YceD family protein [Burkholderiales bacterium]